MNFAAANPAGTNASYPGNYLTQTTWYRRVVNGNKSTPVKITVTGNIYGNTISANQIFTSSPADPALLTGTTPTGGTNNQFAFEWQYSITNAGENSWQLVPSGGNGNDYDPPIIYETTFYRRVVTSNGVISKSAPVTITLLASGSLFLVVM